jgi:putative endonuclease
VPYFVYILECSDKSLYTGITLNLNNRIKGHFNGSSKYTRSKLPVKLVYFEESNDKIEAAKREREIKSWSRKKKLTLVNSSL